MHICVKNTILPILYLYLCLICTTPSPVHVGLGLLPLQEQGIIVASWLCIWLDDLTCWINEFRSKCVSSKLCLRSGCLYTFPHVSIIIKRKAYCPKSWSQEEERQYELDLSLLGQHTISKHQSWEQPPLRSAEPPHSVRPSGWKLSNAWVSEDKSSLLRHRVF